MKPAVYALCPRCAVKAPSLGVQVKVSEKGIARCTHCGHTWNPAAERKAKRSNMKRRAERFDPLKMRNNVEYYGLAIDQRVWVEHPEYTGLAFVVGEPPQGPGVYVSTVPPLGHSRSKRLLVSGENIREATEPSK